MNVLFPHLPAAVVYLPLSKVDNLTWALGLAGYNVAWYNESGDPLGGGFTDCVFQMG